MKANTKSIISYLNIMLLLLSLFLQAGCSRMLNHMYRDSILPEQGRLAVKGLKEKVAVRRDDMGIPFIEADNREDLAFATGFINASDRLNQMVSLKHISQGRLSEMAGPPAIEIDKYIRTLNLQKGARMLYAEVSQANKAYLDRYAEGVNAFIDQYKKKLPPELSLNGYCPEKWEAHDSMTIMAFVGLALSFNIHEEIGSLSIARKVGAMPAAWLLPIYPDEPIPFAETRKLEVINPGDLQDTLQGISNAANVLAGLGFSGVAASNNWAIAGSRTAGKASICANDAHLILSLPSLWNMMHIRCKDIDAAGFGIAGIPWIVSGFNGHVAWGQTMVMADTQDIFLEKLRNNSGRLEYRYKGAWLPVKSREEIIQVKGKDPVRMIVHETIHGPLLNDVIAKDPINHFLIPGPVKMPLGLALAWSAFVPGDKSVDAFMELNCAQSVPQALDAIRKIQAISLNFVLADRDNIAWQVTGRYPVRKKGRGLVPSPGWDGEYDWTGYLEQKDLPSRLNPPEGYVATANNRTVPADYPHILSSSWYWPERFERIREMITSRSDHTYQSNMQMHLDTQSISSARIRQLLLEGPLSDRVKQEIDAFKNEAMRKDAQNALEMLKSFDGNMAVDSRGALIIGALMHTLTHNIFLDELGPEASPAWQGFISCSYISYNAISDHLLVRGDESPFWDNIKTAKKEKKAEILAISLAQTIPLIEEKLGGDRQHWSWGNLHQTNFMTESSKMASHFNLVQRTGMRLCNSFFNRGPFPAAGDHSTLNVSAYTMGKDFDTWLIPSMRLVADFSLEEPFFAVNSTGQSDNPSSPHYDDGIHAWLNGKYQHLPFAKNRIKEHYHKCLILAPEG